MTFWASCQRYKETDKIKALISSEKYDLAIKEAQKESNLINRFNYLGIIYSSQKEYAKAEDYYKKALKKAPDNTKVLYNLGILKLKTRKAKEALKIFKKIEKISSENINAKIKKAWAHYYLASFSNSSATLKEIVRKFKNKISTEQWKEISILYFKLKNYNASAEAYDYYLSEAKKQNIKIDEKKAEKHLKKLRALRNQEL